MKKKIAILGSTGSIGKSTLDIIKKDKKNFEITFLSANSNYKDLVKQAIDLNAKNALIYNKNYFKKVKFLLRKTKTKVYSGNTSLSKIINKKIDYTMSCIVGLAGLQPTIDAIKISKVVAIANKETIICAWEILSKIIKKYGTKVLPVDSEHYSIMELTKNLNNSDIKEIIITASGGPFLNLPLNKFRNIKPNQAVKHPNWKMGKKISVDSSNMMNKVFELIEAFKFFDFDKKKYKIVIHPQSQVHSIIRFKNGLTKMILYDADMKIPISNTLYGLENKFPNQSKINVTLLNNLTFYDVDKKKFPSIKIIDKILNSGQAAPIIINASNEILVSLFLKGKIGFLDIVNTINNIFKDKDIKKYAKKKLKSVQDIKNIDSWARSKTISITAK